MKRPVSQLAQLASASALVLAMGACKSSEFKGGGGDYATGNNRNSGDASKEDLMGNSAFDDDKDKNDEDLGSAGEDGDDANDLGSDGDNGNPNAPNSIVDIIRLCSNNYTQKAKTNLKLAGNGAVVSLLPTPDNENGKAVHFHTASHAKRIRSEIMNYGKFKLPLQKVRSGSYQMVICDAAYASACKNMQQSTDIPKVVGKGVVVPSGVAGTGIRWGTSPGVLGAGVVEVKDGRITDVAGAFIPAGKAQLIEVLTDKNLEDTLMQQTFFNTFAQMTGMGTVQSTTLSQADMKSIQDCDQSSSPLIVDLDNKGIGLSAPFPGTAFDLDGNGRVEHISWPVSTTTPFLALDLNGNGTIDTGAELFGNHSPGPDGTKSANGFLALARYDENRDGLIDARDEVYGRLRLWADDGDAIAAPAELLTLESQGIEAIDLAYTDAKEKDEFGNLTLQRSVVRLKGGAFRMIVDLWFRVL